MRNWHHDLINLNQALLLINSVTPSSLNRVVIGVSDGGLKEFNTLSCSLKSPNLGEIILIKTLLVEV
jgi:hypothetical protein